MASEAGVWLLSVFPVGVGWKRYKRKIKTNTQLPLGLTEGFLNDYLHVMMLKKFKMNMNVEILLVKQESD